MRHLITPYKSKLLVEKIQEEQTGVLWTPEQTGLRPVFATVLAAGSQTVIAPTATVWIGRFSGTPITLGDREYLIVESDEVLGVKAGRSEGGIVGAEQSDT